jgi:hypothetical protein
VKKRKYCFSIFTFFLFIFILCTGCTSPTNTKPIDPNDANGGTNTGDAYVKKITDPNDDNILRKDPLKTDK